MSAKRNRARRSAQLEQTPTPVAETLPPETAPPVEAPPPAEAIAVATAPAGKKKAAAKPAKVEVPSGRGTKLAVLKKILIDTPKATVAEIQAAMVAAGVEACSLSTIQTVRSDLWSTLKVLEAHYGFKLPVSDADAAQAG
jgi:hypothetical protein